MADEEVVDSPEEEEQQEVQDEPTKDMVSTDVMRGRLIAKDRKHKQEMQRMSEELEALRAQSQPQADMGQPEQQQMQPQTQPQMQPQDQPQDFMQQQQQQIAVSQDQIADMVKQAREQERLQMEQERQSRAQQEEMDRYQTQRHELESNVAKGAEDDPEFKEALSNAHHIDAGVFDHLLNHDEAVPVLKKLLSDEKLGKEYSQAGDWHSQNRLINRLAKDAAIERAMKDNKQYQSPFMSTDGASSSVSNPENMSTSEYRKYLKSQGRY